MSVFLHHLIERKRYIVMSCILVILSGILFGFYQYSISSEIIKNFFKELYYFNIENYQNNYQGYLIQNGLYIIICTYLSTSYLGNIGILFLLFCKGIQISFSLFFVFTSVPISFLLVIFIILETIIEVVLFLFISYMCMHMSTYVALVTFYIEQNFNTKSMLNFQLNSLIGTLIIFTISLCFRLYFIPLF